MARGGRQASPAALQDLAPTQGRLHSLSWAKS
ncbi:MAG: hypothetical protein HW408_1597, partial [Actinobacteria bacterium]|nr:hypothetical protein [Actinomycetota bacterium]